MGTAPPATKAMRIRSALFRSKEPSPVTTLLPDGGHDAFRDPRQLFGDPFQPLIA